MRAWLSVALVLAGCSSDETAPTGEKTAAFRGDARVVRVTVEAARERGVPADVLLAIGWAESRLESVTGRPAPGSHEERASRDPSAPCGVFGLDAGTARREAAALVGASADALCHDVALEARAAAAYLHSLATRDGATAPRVTHLDAWLAAADDWHPAISALPYARYLRGVLARGIRATDTAGESIAVPAMEAPMSRASIGRTGAYATPDSPLAEWVGPACDYRPASRVPGDVDYIIIHTCEGGFSGCVSTLANCGGTEVSAHYVTSYTGMIVQIVEENDIGWHVGCLNNTSIGIEHEGFAGADTHPDEQYCQTAKLVREICDRWAIPCDRAHVIGHVEANEMFCMGSHWDPGPGWDWTTFMDYVARGGCECVPDAPEMCNGRDDNCNGEIDEGADCPRCEPIPAGGRIVEENELCFEAGGPMTAWRSVTTAGHGGGLLWTHTTDWADPANYGVWTLDVETEGDYLLCVWSTPEYGESARAVYQVSHAGARDDVTVDQSGAEGWRELGRFRFAAGGGQTVRVDDNTGEPLGTMTRLICDALKVLPASASSCADDPSTIVPDAGPGGEDAGPGGGDAGETADAGRARPREKVEGGCGCTAPGRSRSGPASALGLLALLAIAGAARTVWRSRS